MLKKSLLLFLLAAILLLSAGCASRGEPMEFIRPAPAADARRFTAEDMTVDGITMNRSTLDEAIAVWGEPISRTEVGEGRGLVLQYGFGQVFLNDLSGVFRVNGVTILDGTVAGPRGEKIGDAHATILSAFPDELKQETAEGAAIYLYAADARTDEATGAVAYLEPSCYFSVDGYGAGGLRAVALVPEAGGDREIYYTAFFEAGKISKITINYGMPPVE